MEGLGLAVRAVFKVIVLSLYYTYPPSVKWDDNSCPNWQMFSQDLAVPETLDTVGQKKARVLASRNPPLVRLTNR